MPKALTEQLKLPKAVRKYLPQRTGIVARNPGLNPRQELFVSAYITNGWNATRAAKAAGYSEKCAGVQGSALLKNPLVQAAINSALTRYQLTKEQTLSRLAEIANTNLADFCNEEGEVDWKKVQERGHLIKKRKLRQTADSNGNVTTTCELEAHDPLKALELVGRHHGLFRDQLTIDAEFKLVPLTINPREITG